MLKTLKTEHWRIRTLPEKNIANLIDATAHFYTTFFSVNTREKDWLDQLAAELALKNPPKKNPKKPT